MHQFDSRAIRPESHGKYPSWKYVAPLPSAELMGTVGAADIENFLVVGDAWSQVVTRLVSSTARVLDVGCGCGRIARFLLNARELRYVGLDIMEPSVAWCRDHLAPLAGGRFEFHHVDAHSEHYNPRGRLRAEEVTFPCSDGSVHLAFGASLFTHLLERDARHYLRETNRVLRAGGGALYSILPPAQAEATLRGGEDRVEVSRDYFEGMAAGAGLVIEERLGELCGQETILLRKP
jgi:SAM-dependent methyltransferase